jgi:hypothetical protein
MPNMHKHKVRGLRNIPEDLWTAFEATAQQMGGDRSAILRRYMEWCVGRPGAELPTPDTPDAGNRAPDSK